MRWRVDRVGWIAVTVAAAFAFVLFWPGELMARAGGGHSYGSSSSSSRGSSYSGGSRSGGYSGTYGSSRGYTGSSGSRSSSSGGGGVDIDIDAVELVGIIVIVFVIVVCASAMQSIQYWFFERGLEALLTAVGRKGRSILGSEPGPPATAQLRRAPDGLVRLKALDPNFSRPAFLDFLGLLYTRVAKARGTGDVDPVRAFVLPALLDGWGRRDPARARPTAGVEEIVVGAVTIRDVGGFGSSRIRCEVEFEASMLERRDPATPGSGVWLKERWRLSRSREALSKVPEEIARFGCPSCGAAQDVLPDGRCSYCSQVVNRGDFHWMVESVEILDLTGRPDEGDLVSGGEEVGTDLPTLLSPDLESQSRALQGRHPEFSWDGFGQIACDSFTAIQTAWSQSNLAALRHLETDTLFSTHRFWLERYRTAGLRNVLEDVSVEDMVPVRVELDAFFESITVRIFASMVDYTIDLNQSLRSGRRDEPRRFSEYWTFIAAAGLDLTRSSTRSKCPACGAPIQVSQTGICEHCEVKVTTGRFGWVLSRIDQDESYAG